MHYTDSFNSVLGDRKTPMPVSEKLCKEVVTLPNHQWLTDAEVEVVAKTVRKYYE